MAERFVSERDAGRILEKAARLQEASRDGADGYSPGISVSELERIAAEAGIDAAFLRSALAEPQPPNIKRSFLGQVEEREVVIDGELSEDGWEELNEYLTKQGRFVTMATTARTKSIVMGGSWLTNSKLDITSRKGRTRITFRQPAFLAYFAGLHTPLILSIVLLANFLAGRQPAWIAFSLFGAVLGLGVMLYFFFLRLTRQKGLEFFDGLSELIARDCSRTALLGIQTSTSQAPTHTEEPHLNTHG